MPTAKNLLKITELGEVSFVDKGDNPPAGARILKSAPSTIPGGRVPDPVDVQKQIDEAVAAEVAKRSALEERIAKMEEAEAVAKVEGFCKSNHIAPELVAPLRAIQKAAPAEDFAKVQAEIARLSTSLHEALNALGARVGGVSKGAASAVGKMEAKVAEIMKRDGCDKATAYSKMLNEAPEIYKAYSAELEA